MPTPNHPPEWVQHALRAEVDASFGAGAELTFAEGRAAVLVTAGTGRFTLPLLQSAFGDGVGAGDELELELFWQPVDGAQRVAQQQAYGRVLDYEAFAAQTAPLYRAWRFAVSHFPSALQNARWDKSGLTVETEGHTLVFPCGEWFGETRPAPFGRAVRAKLEAEGFLDPECRSPVDWFGRFREEYLSYARELIFGADQAANGRVSVEVDLQQVGCGFVSDRFRQLVVWQDTNNLLNRVDARVERPRMPGLMHGDVEGMKLVFAPFRWNQCPVTVVGKLALGPEFDAWFSRWFEGDPSPDEKTLIGVIHSVGRPEPMPNGLGLSFTVSFGSAPVEAVAELIGLLGGGAQFVALGVEPHELTTTLAEDRYRVTARLATHNAVP